MRALVTGAGGFIGKHLVARLRGDGVDVLTAGSKAGAGEHYRYTDYTSIEENETLLRSFRPQEIYHLAGIASTADPVTFYRVNTEFAAALLEAVERTAKAETAILLLGTAAEYGAAAAAEMPLRESRPPQPEAHYGISKFAQTLIARATHRRGVRVLLPRAFNIVGPDMPEHTALGNFARQIVAIERTENAPILRVGNLTTHRDFVHVSDAIAVFRQMMAVEACYGRVINICSGQPKLMSEIVEELIAVSKEPIRIEVDATRYKPIDVPTSYGSADLLHQLLGCTLSVSWPTLCADILQQARAGVV